MPRTAISAFQKHVPSVAMALSASPTKSKESSVTSRQTHSMPKRAKYALSRRVSQPTPRVLFRAGVEPPGRVASAVSEPGENKNGTPKGAKSNANSVLTTLQAATAANHESPTNHESETNTVNHDTTAVVVKPIELRHEKDERQAEVQPAQNIAMHKTGQNVGHYSQHSDVRITSDSAATPIPSISALQHEKVVLNHGAASSGDTLPKMSLRSPGECKQLQNANRRQAAAIQQEEPVARAETSARLIQKAPVQRAQHVESLVQNPYSRPFPSAPHVSLGASNTTIHHDLSGPSLVLMESGVRKVPIPDMMPRASSVKRTPHTVPNKCIAPTSELILKRHAPVNTQHLQKKMRYSATESKAGDYSTILQNSNINKPNPAPHKRTSVLAHTAHSLVPLVPNKCPPPALSISALTNSTASRAASLSIPPSPLMPPKGQSANASTAPKFSAPAMKRSRGQSKRIENLVATSSISHADSCAKLLRPGMGAAPVSPLLKSDPTEKPNTPIIDCTVSSSTSRHLTSSLPNETKGHSKMSHCITQSVPKSCVVAKSSDQCSSLDIQSEQKTRFKVLASTSEARTQLSDKVHVTSRVSQAKMPREDDFSDVADKRDLQETIDGKKMSFVELDPSLNTILRQPSPGGTRILPDSSLPMTADNCPGQADKEKANSLATFALPRDALPSPVTKLTVDAMLQLADICIAFPSANESAHDGPNGRSILGQITSQANLEHEKSSAGLASRTVTNEGRENLMIGNTSNLGRYESSTPSLFGLEEQNILGTSSSHIVPSESVSGSQSDVRGQGVCRMNGSVSRDTVRLDITENARQFGNDLSDDTSHDDWVQCEQCDKWRRLPSHVDAKTLPSGQWYCSLMFWDVTSATCSTPQEEFSDSYASEDDVSNQEDNTKKDSHASQSSSSTEKPFKTGAEPKSSCQSTASSLSARVSPPSFRIYEVRTGIVTRTIIDKNEMGRIFTGVLDAYDKQDCHLQSNKPVAGANSSKTNSAAVAKKKPDEHNKPMAQIRNSEFQTLGTEKILGHGKAKGGSATHATQKPSATHATQKPTKLRKSKPRATKMKSISSSNIRPDLACSNSPLTRQTRRSGRQTSTSSRKKFVELPYRYRGLDWHALDGCWKPQEKSPHRL